MIRLKAAIYSRASTTRQDQSCDRQITELKPYAERLGYEVVAVFSETASGAKDNRKIRKQVMALAQSGKIDCILVSELNRWGRSALDLINTLYQLQSWGVSLRAQSGLEFDLTTHQPGSCWLV